MGDISYVKSSGVYVQGLAEFEVQISLLLEKLSPGALQPALNAIYQEFGVMEMQRFKGGGVSLDFGGERWEPITDQTANWRSHWNEGNASAPPLTNTTALRLASITPRVRFVKDMMYLGIDPRDYDVIKDYSKDNNYGIFHQEGMGNNPKREFVTITPEFVAMAGTVISHYIMPGPRGRRPRTTRTGREAKPQIRPRPALEKDRLKRQQEREKREAEAAARQAAAEHLAEKARQKKREKEFQKSLLEEDPVKGVTRFIRHHPGGGVLAQNTEEALQKRVQTVYSLMQAIRNNPKINYSPLHYEARWREIYAQQKKSRVQAESDFAAKYGITLEEYKTISEMSVQWQSNRRNMMEK